MQIILQTKVHRDSIPWHRIIAWSVLLSLSLGFGAAVGVIHMLPIIAGDAIRMTHESKAAIMTVRVENERLRDTVESMAREYSASVEACGKPQRGVGGL